MPSGNQGERRGAPVAVVGQMVGNRAPEELHDAALAVAGHHHHARLQPICSGKILQEEGLIQRQGRMMLSSNAIMMHGIVEK